MVVKLDCRVRLVEVEVYEVGERVLVSSSSSRTCRKEGLCGSSGDVAFISMAESVSRSPRLLRWVFSL